MKRLLEVQKQEKPKCIDTQSSKGPFQAKLTGFIFPRLVLEIIQFNSIRLFNPFTQMHKNSEFKSLSTGLFEVIW